MNRLNLISLDVLVGYLEGIDNSKLFQEIDSDSHDLEARFLADKNHTYYEDKRFPFGKPESEKLISALTEAVRNELQMDVEMDAIWTLTLERGQSVSMHSHKSNTHMRPSEYFSIAYYVNAPNGSADLIFETEYCSAIESQTRISPEPGMLVIFNSFIKHMTNRHDSDEKRIVVSANFVPVFPDTTPTQDWSAYKPLPKNVKAIYGITAHSPLGSEDYKLTLHSDGTATFSNHRESVLVQSYEKSGNHVFMNFDLVTPMIADVTLEFDVNIHGELSGKANINGYANVCLSGSQEA
jgi:hypothetical protein